MTIQVTVIDYGVGNLYSVSRGIERVGATAQLTADAAMVEAAQLLILPGVGAFAHGMAELERRALVEPIRRYAASGRPFLGICLGMQLMFEVSEEFGEHRGLGLLPGRVRAIPTNGTDGAPHKIPHIGWNRIIRPGAAPAWAGTVLAGISEESAMYFVHSFTAHPDTSDRIADADYDGCTISAVAGRGRLFGCQFHPEKSGETGLAILANFVAMASP